MQLKQKIGRLPSKGRWLQQNKKMIMSDSASSVQQASSDTDFSLCTNSTEMVENIFHYAHFVECIKPLKTIDAQF